MNICRKVTSNKTVMRKASVFRRINLIDFLPKLTSLVIVPTVTNVVMISFSRLSSIAEWPQLSLKTIQQYTRRHSQCDQMAKLFVLYCDIYNNENVAKEGSKFSTVLNKSYKIAKVTKFCQIWSHWSQHIINNYMKTSYLGQMTTLYFA